MAERTLPAERQALNPAALPDLYAGCNAVIGLVESIMRRGDLPADLHLALIGNWRVNDAKAAIRKAEMP